jgi:hypothetical protein
MAATSDPLHHEGHEEQEGVFMNVSITLRGVHALRGQFLLSCGKIAAWWCITTSGFLLAVTRGPLYNVASLPIVSQIDIGPPLMRPK